MMSDDLERCDQTAPDTNAAPGSAVLRLSDGAKRTLRRVARQTLVGFLGRGELPDLTADAPELRAPRAVFVTLRRRGTGELRGCRGESQARRPLIEAVAHMAISSASDDTRMIPVTFAELPAIHIEISALTPMQVIAPEVIEVGRHGLMLVQGQHAGLLLPQVPLRYGWGREEFLQALCHKAWLPRNAWTAPGTIIYAFETEIWGEQDDNER